MKNTILSTVLVVISLFSCGSSNFESTMKSTLKKMRVTENVNYTELAHEFSKIAKKNKKRFEPHYYAAYCLIQSSWKITDPGKKKEILEQSKKHIDKANKLTQNNDELMVLEALYYQAYIMINPREYGNTYSIKAEEMLQKAQAVNKDNPRAAFLRGQNMYHRPAEYGGGKEKALPLFNQSAKMFKSQNTDDFLIPTWGEKTNSEMIKLCKA